MVAAGPAGADVTTTIKSQHILALLINSTEAGNLLRGNGNKSQQQLVENAAQQAVLRTVGRLANKSFEKSNAAAAAPALL